MILSVIFSSESEVVEFCGQAQRLTGQEAAGEVLVVLNLLKQRADSGEDCRGHGALACGLTTFHGSSTGNSFRGRAGVPCDTLRPNTWDQCRDLAAFLGGPNPALPADVPYSQEHFGRVIQALGEAKSLDKYATYFIELDHRRRPPVLPLGLAAARKPSRTRPAGPTSAAPTACMRAR